MVLQIVVGERLTTSVCIRFFDHRLCGVVVQGVGIYGHQVPYVGGPAVPSRLKILTGTGR